MTDVVPIHDSAIAIFEADEKPERRAFLHAIIARVRIEQANAARWEADYHDKARAYEAVYAELTALKQGRAT